MPRYLLIVLSNALPGTEDEYARWYDEEHIPHVLALPGMLSAQRFDLANDEYAYAKSDHRCLVLYECDVDSPEEAWAMFREARADGRTTASPLMAPNTKAWFYVPVGEGGPKDILGGTFEALRDED